ncbi:MAG: hypothetical protein IKR23_11160 [Lachnospiraceae bacterium]|nr:hypothetical protein [Lachnospiraceae bacterium]
MADKKKVRLIYNIIMTGFVLYAWLIMFFNTEEGMLTARGLINLKFYTTLSNIFAAVVAVIWIIDHLRKKDNPSIALWKLMSAAAVGVTFTVVIGFLGPLYGFGTMYVGSNFFLHLVVPVMAMAEFIIFNERKMSVKDNLFVILPPLVYGTVYVINTLINGVKGNDIYGFLIWGYPIGILIFIVICFAAFMIGLVLLFINSKLINKKGNGLTEKT